MRFSPGLKDICWELLGYNLIIFFLILNSKSHLRTTCCTDAVDTGFLKELKKAIPLQAWTGPQGSRRLMLPDF
jgi:hypothetical protein